MIRRPAHRSSGRRGDEEVELTIDGSPDTLVLAQSTDPAAFGGVYIERREEG